MKDTEWIQAASEGDFQAFNELVLKYQDQVFNLARRILRNHVIAEDIAQDTFIRAFQKINQFRGGSFRAWLLKIAANLCYDEMRTWQRHPLVPLEPMDWENAPIESPWWIRDPAPLPEEEADMNDLRQALEDGLDRLPVKNRIIVTLVDIHGLDYKEASHVTGVPLGTVKSRLARGRMQLGRFLMDVLPQFASESPVFNVKTAAPPVRSR